jgi:hypothetical protein
MAHLSTLHFLKAARSMREAGATLGSGGTTTTTSTATKKPAIKIVGGPAAEGPYVPPPRSPTGRAPIPSRYVPQYNPGGISVIALPPVLLNGAPIPATPTWPYGAVASRGHSSTSGTATVPPAQQRTAITAASTSPVVYIGAGLAAVAAIAAAVF